ncbi:hypothetical protein CGMCC3_g17507 [Colletotrichum fructicola]|uniref:Uncharacterized protein n=1 Tax=Colletotrichum fructicola (strain Nara gc5) TaxID=1213859 RepID=A0A7J6ISI4_COLFN|nr:uncharacterized protein CGMCC3_g17507 [Colletotrichum fructicola]KAE9566324.1 hypothetical protein CGMCC3_g17507 [Colletotrichum fructicola]KAF4479849.1 hypothetical protein CGGC5_v011778 [Colletotrichum fructicola Nara gc5]KAF5490761.1 hypothetical protein CGCF413_v010764 [Colletotrichum fructicola]
MGRLENEQLSTRGQTKRRDSFTPSEANAATPLHDLKCSPNRPVSRHGPGSSPDAPRSLVVPVPVPVPDSPATGGGLAPSPLPASTSAPAVTSFIPDHKGCPTTPIATPAGALHHWSYAKTARKDISLRWTDSCILSPTPIGLFQ